MNDACLDRRRSARAGQASMSRLIIDSARRGRMSRTSARLACSGLGGLLGELCESSSHHQFWSGVRRLIIGEHGIGLSPGLRTGYMPFRLTAGADAEGRDCLCSPSAFCYNWYFRLKRREGKKWPTGPPQQSSQRCCRLRPAQRLIRTMTQTTGRPATYKPQTLMRWRNEK